MEGNSILSPELQKPPEIELIDNSEGFCQFDSFRDESMQLARIVNETCGRKSRSQVICHKVFETVKLHLSHDFELRVAYHQHKNRIPEFAAGLMRQMHGAKASLS